MSHAQQILAQNNDLPIKTEQSVHSGKVRSVYWLSKQDSQRLIKQHGYAVAPEAELAVMVISDRLSAFDCIWHGENGLNGVPGKGAALNSIANHWFRLFKHNQLAASHILDVPHPLVWIVQKAQPVKIEAIARRYITGSMWRAYENGEREFCGQNLPEGLNKNQRLDELLITPSTKGILKGLDGVPEADDVNISRADIERHYRAFGFNSLSDIDLYEKLLKQGFEVIAKATQAIGQIFVDTKFEFGYITNRAGVKELIYMDEVGTPDSSRLWDAEQFKKGTVVENSKEYFRQALLNHFPDPDILLNKNRMFEREALAKNNALPEEMMMQVSQTYTSIAEQITGSAVYKPENPKAEIIATLNDRYQLIR
ncbi:phosphoribosylaminoimidazolesuccinocarboxamide synthase [Sessilibacter sp. MAH2]